MDEGPEVQSDALYRFTNGEQTAAIYQVGTRDGIPQVRAELRDNESGRPIPLSHEEAAGLLQELQSLSTYTRSLAQEQERGHEAEGHSQGRGPGVRHSF